MRKIIDQSNSRFIITVQTDKHRPINHLVTVMGVGYYQQELCPTSKLEDTCAKMEYDARLSTKPAFEIVEKIEGILKDIGFEENESSN